MKMDAKKFDSDSRFKKDFVALTEKIRATGEISLNDADFDYLPTLRCNMRCRLCYQKHTKETNRDSIKNEMTFEQFKALFDKIDVEGKIVKFIGGEPFVKKELFDMMEYFKKRNAYNVIGTNGFVVGDEEIKKMREMNMVEVTSSIDGLEETHNKVRGHPELFQRASHFIKEMAKTHKVLMETVIQKENLDELAKIIQYKNLWNIYKWRFALPMFATKEILEETRILLDEPELEFELAFFDKWDYGFSYEAFIKAFNELKTQGIEFATHPPYLGQYPKLSYEKKIRDHFNVYCTYLFRIRIEPDGMLRPCPFMIRFFGDLKKQSLEETWNSEDYKTFRKKLLASNLTPICEACGHIRILNKK